jgi:pimeloyl-ACP methyl ester carboxylesterase
MAGVSGVALVFVHSPLVGPLTWRAVANHLTATGWHASLPDLTGAMAGPAPYQPRIAQAVAAATQTLDRPAVLIGHSAAGPLLPGLATHLPVPVRALVYADARLPYPGRTWFETAPADLVSQLRSMATDGRLPPWHEWFPPDAVATLLPDARQRAEFIAELSTLPLAYFDECMPEIHWSGRYGYLLLSEAYRDQARRAAETGAPVVEQLSHHLAPLTSPDTVASGLVELLRALTVHTGR